MTTTTYEKKITILFFLLIIFSTLGQSATLFENFDNPSATVNSFTGSGANITYSSSGVWFTYYNKMSDVDHFNGTGGLRVRGYSGHNNSSMMFDKVGAGVVSFNYASYSGQSGGVFTLQQSINQGSTWTDVGSAVTVSVWNGSMYTYSAVVNYNGNIRFRINMSITSDATGANSQVNIDDFEITDYGVNQTSIPVMSTPTGIYQTSQNVTLTSATQDATIYYTTDGTIPTVASSSVYSSPIPVSQTTTVKAMAVSAGNENSRVQTAIVNIPVVVNNLAALAGYMPVSGTNLQYYKYTGEAVINFIYWISSTSTAKKILIQDATGGMLIDDNYKLLTTAYNNGDKITNLTGQVYAVNDSPLLYPSGDFTVLSGGNTVTSSVITLVDVPTRVNQLVQINDLYFDGANGTTKFGVNSFLTVHDASTPSTTSIVYNTPSVIAVNPDYVGTVVPTKMNIVCLVMKNNPLNSGINNNNAYYYLFPRSSADLNVVYKPISGILNQTIQRLSVTNGKVYFETLSSEKVDVYLITGQKIKSIISQNGINTIDLPNGIYAIKIGTNVSKVIVQ